MTKWLVGRPPLTHVSTQGITEECTFSLPFGSHLWQLWLHLVAEMSILFEGYKSSLFLSSLSELPFLCLVAGISQEKRSPAVGALPSSFSWTRTIAAFLLRLTSQCVLRSSLTSVCLKNGLSWEREQFANFLSLSCVMKESAATFYVSLKTKKRDTETTPYLLRYGWKQKNREGRLYAYPPCDFSILAWFLLIIAINILKSLSLLNISYPHLSQMR